MAHFAQLDENNIVTQVIVVNNETLGHLDFPDSETVGVEFCQSLLGADTFWKQTSYNNNFRKVYAGIGFSYDPTSDRFIPPKSYPSWVMNETTGYWEPPLPEPDDDENFYQWDEDIINWVVVEQQSKE